MATQSRRTREGWFLVDDMVRRWMQLRIELTHDFEAIVTKEGSDEPVSALIKRLNTFCQTLMDYASAGHFEIYNELITEAREFNDGSLEMGFDLYRAIARSTDVALVFNEKYESTELSREHLADLPRDMTELGNVLNLRFELEDKMISTVHDSHRPLVA